MHKTLIVLRHELSTILRSPVYLLLALGVPVLAVVVVLVLQWVPSRPTAGGAPGADAPDAFQLAVEGYVDLSGLVHAVPPDFPADHLLAFATEAEAQQALAAGRITAYYVVPADYLERGRVDYVYPDSRPLIEDGQGWVMARTLIFNLLEGDLETTDRVWNPIRRLDTENLAAPAAASAAGGCSRPGFSCEANALIRYLPLVMMMLFYVSFLTSSNLLFNSIGREKENRTLEVVLLSVRPRQLLAGKFVGLGIAGLLQTAAWMGGIFLSLRFGGSVLSLPAEFHLPPEIVGWSLVFFLGGYATYASLMAGAGALVPRLKEAGGANVIAMIPLLISYVIGFLAALVGATNEALPIALSFFPLTAPVLMVMRLTEGGVPVWQLLLAAGLTFGTAGFVFQAVVALFTAQSLLSGQPFSLRRYLGAIFGARLPRPA